MQQKDTTDGADEDNDDEFAELDDDFEIDEAELEAMKETPIDKLNAFDFFVQNFWPFNNNKIRMNSSLEVLMIVGRR